MPGHTRDEWKDIVDAIERSVPLYESISEKISFNLARPLRLRAILRLGSAFDGWVIDAGIGPGVSTRLLVSQGFKKIIGLDPSRQLLTFAKTELGRTFDPVVGVGENLPLRTGSIANGLTCFSFRDVMYPKVSIAELARVIQENGTLCIVDIGKPDNPIIRSLVSFYIHNVMPRLTVALIRRRLRGNPFLMIVPTFDRLVTNSTLGILASSEFGPTKVEEFMLGALIIVVSKRSRSSNDG